MFQIILDLWLKLMSKTPSSSGQSIVGIDPGNGGAIAIINHLGANVIDMPLVEVDGKQKVNAVEVYATVLLCNPYAVFIEQVHSMPKQGVASTFKFGESYGIIQGVIALLGVPVVYVLPRQWKASYGLVGGVKDDARLKALEVFPELSDRLKRKKDVDRADALLIAQFGMLNCIDIPVSS